MDLAHRAAFDSVVARVSVGIREIPRRLARRLAYLDSLRSAASHPALRSALLLAAALLFGSWAHGLSTLEGRESFERDHPPSLRAWEVSVAPFGFHRERNSDRLQRALRKLPSRFEGEDGTVWISADHDWIALLQTERPEEPPAIVCKRCEESPLQWKPAGRGWDALDALLSALEKDQAARHDSPRPKRVVWVDPRELRF